MSIPASYDTLMRQAPATASLYMREGVREIDALFGEDYAKKNPLLLAAFMSVSAIDMAAATIGKEIGEGAGDLANYLDGIAIQVEAAATVLKDEFER